MAKRVSFVSDLIRQYTTGTVQRLRRFDGSGIANTLSEVERLSRAFWERREAIAADERLTGAGRTDALRNAGRETLAALEKWHEPLRKGLDAHQQQLMSEILASVTPSSRSSDLGDRLEGALLRSEVRRAAQGMDALQLEILYRNGDATVRKALEELPNITVGKHGVSVRPFIPDELRHEVLLEAGRRARPEAAEQIHDIVEVRGVYNIVAAALKREIEQAAPGAVDPPAVRVVA